MTSAAPLNSQKHIAVIGAGIVGVSTAIWLQRNGHRVTLIDREGPAAGTSYGNGGVLASCGIIPVNSPGLLRAAPAMAMHADSPLFIRWSYLPKMLPWLMRYIRRANKRDATATARALTTLLFDSLEQHQQLARGTGAEKWLKPSDYIFIYRDQQAFDKDRFGWDTRREMGYSWAQMSSEEFDEYDPIFKSQPKIAIRLNGHGHVSDPGKYVSDLARHFERQGGKLVIAEVNDVQNSNGEVRALMTSDGKIDCDSFVLCAGIWSTPLAKKLGIDTAMETERGYHIELINPSIMPRAPMMLTSGKFVVTPMDGRMRCAGVVEFGGLDAPPSSGPIALLKKQIHQAIPGLTYDSVEEWMGHRPAPSDSLPLIGPIKNLKGAYVAFGHHHIGLTGGPKTGRIIADIISAKKTNINLAPYEVSRFTHQLSA